MDAIDKINELLKQKGFTQAALAKHIGLAPPNLNKILKRQENRQFKSDQLYGVADYFGVNANYFASGVERPVNFVPVVSNSSCGSSQISTLQDFGRKALYNGDYWKKSLYCVIACGDSMAPDIEDGDEIIIDPDVTPTHGDMVHYKIDGESAVKILVKDEDAHIIQFVPYNQSEDFKTKTVRLDDQETLDRLEYFKVVSVNKLKFNNRLARLKMIGR